MRNLKSHVLSFLVFVGVLLGAPAWADTINYEIYRLNSDGSRKLLAEGKKEYQLADVLVEPGAKPAEKYWQKSVVVWEDFSVGVSVHLDHELTGFGLWIERETNSFSWDWFDLEEGTTFRKLQGPGLVRIETKKTDGMDELIAVEFLTDVTLRGQFSHLPFMPLPEEDTHHLVVKKGSVLRVAGEG